MTLYDLGKQYLERSQKITERIHQLTPKVKTQQGKALFIMKRRILLLYNDAAECKRCALRLMSYENRDLKGKKK